MLSLVLIVVCLVIGIALQKVLKEGSHVTLNTIILYVPLPAVCLLHVPTIQWDASLLSVALVAWIIFGFSYLFFTQLGPRLGWSRNTQGCLILTAGLCNSAFVGFPVIEALYGAEGLKYAILLDQPGSFLIVSSLAIVVATQFSGASVRPVDLVKKIISFPPFIGFSLSLCLSFFGWQSEGDVKTLLQKLASILTPLAMISVGLQLRLNGIRDELPYLFTGLLFKLFLAPVLIYFIYQFMGLEKTVFQIVVLESAMATMITAAIVASAYGLNPRLSGLMVGISVPLSFVTLTVWFHFLQ